MILRRIYDVRLFSGWMSRQIQNQKYHHCHHKSHYQQWNWLQQAYQRRHRNQNHAFELNCLMYLKFNLFVPLEGKAWTQL